MIKLIFSMVMFGNPEHMVTKISDRDFESIDQCKTFVEAIVTDDRLTWAEDNTTQFVSVDGIVFFVKCAKAGTSV